MIAVIGDKQLRFGLKDESDKILDKYWQNQSAVIKKYNEEYGDFARPDYVFDQTAGTTNTGILSLKIGSSVLLTADYTMIATATRSVQSDFYYHWNWDRNFPKESVKINSIFLNNNMKISKDIRNYLS